MLPAMVWGEAPAMHAHRIGQQLRAVLLRDRRERRPFDPRRLQAVIGDLCGDDHPELVAPLRYLVLSGAFASAVGMDPPLAEGRLLQRLQTELAQMYAAPLCARLQPLLEGLLDLPASPMQAARLPAPAPVTGGGDGRIQPPGAVAAAAFASAAAAQPAVVQGSEPPAGAPSGAAAPLWQGERVAAPAAGRSSAGGSAALPAALAFLAGVLLMALAGVGLLLWQRHSAPQPGATAPPASPASSALPAGSPTPAAPGSDAAALPAAPTLPPAEFSPEPNAAPLDRAVSSIQALYAALSLKDFDRARGLFSEAAADQFDPGFFRQFERVSVQDLEATGQVGSSLNLQGVVTFVWPDGSLQSETRSFSVDTSSDPARITASEFGRVIRPR